MKALVIGGSGIIGNHVIRALLSEGIIVRSLTRGITPSKNLDDLNVETMRGDASDEDTLLIAMKGCDWVFHTAAYYPTHMFDRKGHVNSALNSIRTFISAVSKSALNKVVYTSSLTTIGMAKTLADETVPYNLAAKLPHPYFEVKYLMEDEIKKAALIKQLPITIVNPTGCFGPYELKPKNLCIIPQLVNQKMPAFVDHCINVVDAADVAKGHVESAKRGKNGDRVVLGGHNTTVFELITTICKVAKVKPPRFQVPLSIGLIPCFLSECIGYMTNTPPMLPILGLRFIQYGQKFDLSKQTQSLGVIPSPMEPCFERAINWYKKIGYC